VFDSYSLVIRQSNARINFPKSSPKKRDHFYSSISLSMFAQLPVTTKTGLMSTVAKILALSVKIKRTKN
jgi:hypothetical protein